MSASRVISLFLLVLFALPVLPLRAEDEPSPSHRALQELLVRIDAPGTVLGEAELGEVASLALEHLSVLATSERHYRGIPEKYVGANLALQVGNVLLHRYQRVEDAQTIARVAGSVYSGGDPEAGALMQQALSGTRRGLDQMAGESRFEATRELSPRSGSRRLAMLGCLGVVLCGIVFFLVRGSRAAPRGLTLVDAGMQNRAQGALSQGIELLREERLEEAIRCFQRVAEIESSLQSSGQYFLALVSLQQGDVERTRTLVEGIDFSRIETEEAYSLGDALERRGQPRLARRVFEKIYLGDVAFKDVKDRLDHLREETESYSEEDVADVIVKRILDPRFADPKLVASGGMGFVFEARDTAAGDIRRALKVLSPFYANDQDAYVRFVHEARGLAALQHPGIIRIHDVFERSLPYYSMDFHDSPDLKDILAGEGRLAPARVRDLGIQLCSALGAAHRAGVVHRDVKPANVLLGEGDRITLLDFGIARFDAGTRVTLTGQVLGSPRYMAPEQFLGDEMDHRVDIYSAGLVLYELLTGDLPEEQSRHHAGVDFPRPDEHLGLPGGLVEAVLGALAHDPEARYEDMDEMVELLEACPVELRS